MGGRTAHGIGWLGATIVVGLVIGAAPAAAETTVRLTQGSEGRFEISPKVKVVADDARNRIAVDFDAARDAFVISDRERIVAEQCERITRTSVRCVHNDPDAEVLVLAAGGNDRVTIAPGVPTRAGLSGGPGRDRLRAGRGDDDLSGGDGRDRLTGRGGSDFIEGGRDGDVLRGNAGGDDLSGDDLERDPGRDMVIGGPGNDFCATGSDGVRDAPIDCGGGEDTASVGRNDPRPSHCERLIRVDSRARWRP